jgi:regulator of sirC expression with transglutaminase-like and TPR domain
MTREEAEDRLATLGRAPDETFPLLEAAICCALHDYPFRDADPVRRLADAAAARLAERLQGESPDDALTETLGADLGLDGDLMDESVFGGGDPANTDVIAVAGQRRGLSVALAVFYLDAARRGGVEAHGVDFPNHFLLRVETEVGPVALDPFSHGRIVLPSELTRRALRAGLTPHVADRLDLLMAPVSDRQALLRLHSLQFHRAMRRGDHAAAERSALRRALLGPEDHRPWLDVAAARERQGVFVGALQALDRARAVSGDIGFPPPIEIERLRLRLN